MLEFGALLQMVPAVALFVTQHWDSILAACTAMVMLFQALKTREYAKVWPVAIDLVKRLAETEMSGPEKRKEVAKGIHDVLPLWLKGIMSQTELEQLAEKAYLFVRGELKQSNK